MRVQRNPLFCGAMISNPFAFHHHVENQMKKNGEKRMKFQIFFGLVKFHGLDLQNIDEN